MSTRRQGSRGRRVVSAPPGAVDLSGVFAKYDLAAANVTKNGSNLISQVNDQSGNNYHLTATVDANKLLWVSADLNGVDVAQANDTAQRRAFKTSGLPLSSELGITVALVVRVDAANSAGQYIKFMDHSKSTGTDGVWLGSFSTTNTRNMGFISSAFAVTSFTFGAMSLATWEIWVVRATSTALNAACNYQSARVNGAVVATSGTGTFQAPSSGTPNLFLCNKQAATATNFKVAELHYWRRALNDASVASLEATLNAKYAIY